MNVVDATLTAISSILLSIVFIFILYVFLVITKNRLIRYYKKALKWCSNSRPKIIVDYSNLNKLVTFAHWKKLIAEAPEKVEDNYFLVFNMLILILSGLLVVCPFLFDMYSRLISIQYKILLNHIIFFSIIYLEIWLISKSFNETSGISQLVSTLIYLPFIIIMTLILTSNILHIHNYIYVCISLAGISSLLLAIILSLMHSANRKWTSVLLILVSVIILLAAVCLLLGAYNVSNSKNIENISQLTFWPFLAYLIHAGMSSGTNEFISIESLINIVILSIFISISNFTLEYFLSLCIKTRQHKRE